MGKVISGEARLRGFDGREVALDANPGFDSVLPQNRSRRRSTARRSTSGRSNIGADNALEGLKRLAFAIEKAARARDEKAARARDALLIEAKPAVSHAPNAEPKGPTQTDGPADPAN